MDLFVDDMGPFMYEGIPTFATFPHVRLGLSEVSSINQTATGRNALSIMRSPMLKLSTPLVVRKNSGEQMVSSRLSVTSYLPLALVSAVALIAGFLR